MTQPLVTILVPNYKTLELTKLCLRLLRKFTDPEMAKVIVIDNDSQDESLDYLRSVKWISLIERKAVPGESPVVSHSRALDLGLECVTTPYVLSIHTDTLVKNSQWLHFLIKEILKRPTIAGVGSWKLESKPFWRRVLKNIERQMQLAFYSLTGKNNHGLEGVGKNYYYLRSHCALYRMDVMRQLNLHFTDGDMVAGKYMHKQIIEAGYEMVFIPSDILINYVEHINHATTVLNPELSTREKSVIRGMRRIENSLKRLQAEVVMADAELDN
ncbi:MAG TPA: glycosyltransferase family 2 protein [Gammaproteobacteria bacterium]|nr:glycosyltransferase family 2 protein [Gammaproteobacteria bacterium]